MRSPFATYRAERAEVKARPSNWVLGANLPGGTANVQKTGYDLGQAVVSGYQKSAILAICVDTLARIVAEPRWVLAERGVALEDADEAAIIEQPGRTTREFLLRMATMHLDLCGNTLTQVVGKGASRQLNILNPDWVEARKADAPDDSWYRMRVGRRAPGDPEFIPEAEMVHAMHPDPLNPFWGLSRLVALAPHIEYDSRSIRHNLALVANDGVPRGAWLTENRVPPEELDKLRAKLQAATKGEREGAAPVHAAGLKFQSIGLSPREMDWERGARHAAYIIAAFFGISIYRIFPEASTYDNMASAAKAELTQGAMPRWNLLSEALSHRLLTEQQRRKGLRLVPDLSKLDVLRDDYNDNAQAYERLVGNLVPPAQAARMCGLAVEYPDGIGEQSWRHDNVVPAELSEIATSEAPL